MFELHPYYMQDTNRCCYFNSCLGWGLEINFAWLLRIIGSATLVKTGVVDNTRIYQTRTFIMFQGFLRNNSLHNISFAVKLFVILLFLDDKSWLSEKSLPRVKQVAASCQKMHQIQQECDTDQKPEKQSPLMKFYLVLSRLPLEIRYLHFVLLAYCIHVFKVLSHCI